MIPDCGREVREQGLDMTYWYRLIAKIEFGQLEKKVLVFDYIMEFQSVPCGTHVQYVCSSCDSRTTFSSLSWKQVSYFIGIILCQDSSDTDHESVRFF